jgi:preprotein translocase subunit SecD
MRKLVVALLLIAVPLAAQVVTGKLTIAGEPFAPSDVIDARAMPDPGSTAGIMLTLTPKAAARLQKLTAGLTGKPMIVTLDGKPLLSEMIRGPIEDGVINIPGNYRTVQAEALAKRISGKDPLPEDLAE